MKLELSSLGRFYSRLKLRTQTVYISASLRVSIERGSWIFFDSRITMDNSVRVREWVLRNVFGYLLTLYSNWIFQWECESEYWGRFSDFFWLPTQTGYFSEILRMKLESSSLGRLYSRLKLHTQTVYISGSLRASIERGSWICFESLPRLKLRTQTVYFSASVRTSIEIYSRRSFDSLPSHHFQVDLLFILE